MVWCSLSVAKVSSYHQGAVKMLYAIMMSFCYSPRHDVRTDPWVVFPLLHSDIFIYPFDFVLLSFWNSAFQNTMFSPLSDLMKSLSLFPPSFSSFQIPPSSPLPPLPQLAHCVDAAAALTPLLLQRWRLGLPEVKMTGGERMCRYQRHRQMKV